jgi:hypothetical protein
MKNGNITLVDMYNKDNDTNLYRAGEHLHAKSQRSKEEVLKDSKAYLKAVNKYCDFFVKNT